MLDHLSPHHTGQHDHSALIQELWQCALKCEACATACLQESEAHRMARCIELNRDCADICLLTARLLQRNSPVAHHIMVTCAEMCQMCADECRKHEHDHCIACADSCEQCAAACNTHMNNVGDDVTII